MKTFKEWVEELTGEPLVEASKSKIRADSLQAVSNFNTFPTADYYSLYRMGVAMASMPDEMKGDALGPAGNRPLTLGYTAEEQRMIELVGKLMGHKSVSITGPGSKELDDTNATSPVSDWNKKKMKIRELLETATAGATSSGNIASLGGSPHVVAGTPAVLKRWSGSPGKTGKSIKHKAPKKQTPKDNALDKKGGILA